MSSQQKQKVSANVCSKGILRRALIEELAGVMMPL